MKETVSINDAALKKIAWERRLRVLDMVYESKSGHIGGSFSALDILVTLYHAWFDVEKIKRRAPDRDRFVLSKGHVAEALYTVLAGCGFFDEVELASFARFGTAFAEHPTPHIPGVEMATGSLGHGLSLAGGMAYGLKQDLGGGIPDVREANRQRPPCVVCLMGDGEQAEGSVWEAAMSAAKFGLDNLTAIIDRNGLQISGKTEEVMPLDDLAAKYRAFGWSVAECDGHESSSIIQALAAPHEGKPQAIIAHTTKGYGSPVLENIPACHHMIPTEEQYRQIKKDLEARL